MADAPPSTQLQKEKSVVSKVTRLIPEPMKATVTLVLDILGRAAAATAKAIAGTLSDVRNEEFLSCVRSAIL